MSNFLVIFSRFLARWEADNTALRLSGSHLGKLNDHLDLLRSSCQGLLIVMTHCVKIPTPMVVA